MLVRVGSARNLIADLKAGVEGVHYEADMDTCMRFGRGQHGTKIALRTQDEDQLLWRRIFSHAQ